MSAPVGRDSGISLLVHGGAGSLGDEGDPDGALHSPVAGRRRAPGCGPEGRRIRHRRRRGGGDHVGGQLIFSAGTGSALTEDGAVECDASVMSGQGAAGAVGAVRDIKNPVRLARLVMERTPTCCWSGRRRGVRRQARCAAVAGGRLITDRMRAKWQGARAEPAAPAATAPSDASHATPRGVAAATHRQHVVELPGRVGRLGAIVGAGTYAETGPGRRRAPATARRS